MYIWFSFAVCGVVIYTYIYMFKINKNKHKNTNYGHYVILIILCKYYVVLISFNQYIFKSFFIVILFSKTENVLLRKIYEMEIV